MVDNGHSLDPVSIEHRLTMLETLREADVGMVRANEAAAQRALVIQGKEYERRLEALNGERRRENKHMTLFLPRETYDSWLSRYEQKLLEDSKWRDAVNSALAIAAGKGQGVNLAWGVGLALVGVAFGVWSRL